MAVTTEQLEANKKLARDYIDQVFNHHNPAGFSFVQTSRTYGQATSFTGTRKVDIGLNLTF